VNFSNFAQEHLHSQNGILNSKIDFSTQQDYQMFNLKALLGMGLDATAAIEGYNNGTVTVVDLRELSEVRVSGRAKGAVHIPLSCLQDRANPKHPEFVSDLKTEDCIALYCASGARSMAGRRILKKLGYRNVHNIGGLGHWQRAGGLVESI
jgi:rhodanese-related sulfurtransferase